jgi:hypothetical protein
VAEVEVLLQVILLDLVVMAVAERVVNDLVLEVQQHQIVEVVVVVDQVQVVQE